MRLPIASLLAFAGMLLMASVGEAQTPRATITFDNQSGQEAMVKVIGPVRPSATVPNGQKRTVKVSGGRYYILTRYGSTPDTYTYAKGDPFQVTQTTKQYSIITITLHKVVNGNYQTTPVSASEFNNAAR